MAALEGFHPAVAAWFANRFARPTPAQEGAWPAIRARRHVLVSAPTGSGKTLAAMLAAIDELVGEGMAGALPDQTRVLYVSPLKALSNDIERNLAAPLAGIQAELAARGLPAVDVRAVVRTGDTPQRERASMRRRPPHIVVTTPESLYILLGSESGRAMLATVRTVIVDEIHAVAGGKRGAHLSLSLARLARLCEGPGRTLTRVGLSATQTPIEEVARFLTGDAAGCEIVDAGHGRARDLQLELPPAPLEAVMSGEVWSQVYDRLAQLIAAHRTTLVFVNTRRLAERVARALSERLGAQRIMAHHGSMARERRLAAEQRLKGGELAALVATASLELGIDIGDVDLVCQLASPRSINTFLQRVGRAGHAVDGVSRGRLFPLSRDELVEAAALLRAVRQGQLDRLHIPDGPLDVLAQQLAAEVAAGECTQEALYALARRAWPYRDLERARFDAVVRMLAEGFSTREGRRGALLHRDAVHGVLRPRRGTRLTALTSGGAIPDTADYQVLLEPQSHCVGTVNEDFAIESMAGDIFQLGNTSYRILRVERGTVRVQDAAGAPPTIPFWLGEAPGRSNELSAAVAQLRGELAAHLAPHPQAEPAVMPGADPDAGAAAAPGRNRPGAARTGEGARRWLMAECGIDESAAAQLTEYLAAAHAALGCLPTQDTVVLERFFDEAGGMQLVLHAPFGSRVNRAWGLALRKRFCRQFNFELQAAATEDALVLSLTTAHSFELADAACYLHSGTALQLLVQALLAAPMFVTRWRWAAAVALALPRLRGGRKVPPALMRMNAEDLLAAVFPDQVACAENLPGEIEVPEHPLVEQTIADCLHEAMDAPGLLGVLRRLESGDLRVVACDLTEPSPLAAEVLSARPYAFLDDAPLEERRTRAVMNRRWLDPRTAADLGRLDAAAIERVRQEAWPQPRSPDELHDALLWLTFITGEEATRGGWQPWLAQLAADGRAVQLATPAGPRWAAAERLGLLRALWPALERRKEQGAEAARPGGEAVAAGVGGLGTQGTPAREEALVEVLRGRVAGLGPVSAAALAGSLGLPQAELDAALAVLQAQGSILRGCFEGAAEQWCERGLLARIHRYTVKRLRAEIEPVAARDFVRFLVEWQRVAGGTRTAGPDAVAGVLDQLEGCEAAASAWESDVLPARIADYEPAWLDEQCLAGRYIWTRFAAAAAQSAPVRATPITFFARRNLRLWAALAPPLAAAQLSAAARAVAEALGDLGATFFDEIVDAVRLLPAQVEEALAELVAHGAVNADSFNGLRALLQPAERRRPGARRGRRGVWLGMADSGRWSLVRRAEPAERGEAVEHVVRVLLRRWGVLFNALLAAEGSWLPPWRELLMCCRRLEARGELRGGRFVDGFAGEQYALPEAVGALREVRRRASADQQVAICGADPLNIVGILTPGARLPGLSGNRLLLADGVPVALWVAGEPRFLAEMDEAQQWRARNAMLRSGIIGS